MGTIAAVGRALPDNYYDQDTLIAALRPLWAVRHHNLERLEQIHRNAMVGGRYLALPLEKYQALRTFTQANDHYVRVATELGARALQDALSRAELSVRDIDHIFFVSSTGLATPSIDARIINRLGLRSDIKRTPLFCLGCVAGVAGVSRAADYLRSRPSEIAALVSVELCSLTLQREDLSIANVVSSGLFGDGAAALVLSNEPAREGPRVLDTLASFYPDTERVMGWDIGTEGLKIVLSADVPRVVERHIRRDVDRFLGLRRLTRRDISAYICHPGGPRVLQALTDALELDDGELELSWATLRELGNLSSASVLMVLGNALERRKSRGEGRALMLAMGPGFCSELVLLAW